MEAPHKIVITGINSNPLLFKCFTCARQLKDQHSDRVADFEFFSLFPAQWDMYLRKLQNDRKGEFYAHKGNLIVFLEESN